MADKKSSVWTSLPMQMMFGLVLGVVVGAFTNPEFAQTWFRPLGDLFIRLIRMVVVPLVFACSPPWLPVPPALVTFRSSAALPFVRWCSSWSRRPSLWCSVS